MEWASRGYRLALSKVIGILIIIMYKNYNQKLASFYDSVPICSGVTMRAWPSLPIIRDTIAGTYDGVAIAVAAISGVPG